MLNLFQTTYNTDQNDQELIFLAVNGDKAALEGLVKKHQPFIYNLAWKMVRCPDDAADMTQEVLVKVITHLADFKGKSAFRTWLYRIVVNYFLQTKRRSHEIATESFDDHNARLDSLPDYDLTDMEVEEFQREIDQIKVGCMSGMLLCLTREQRMIYILGDIFKADHNIGAEVMGLTPGNFRVKLSRARKELTNYMANKCGLVNAANPCKCRKKVKAIINNQIMDRNNLLANNKNLVRYNTAIESDALEIADILEDKAAQLYSSHYFQKEFDRKGFLEDVLADEKVVALLNLNLN